MNKIIEDYTKRNDKNAGGLSLYGRERGGLFRSIIGRGKKVIDLGANHGALTQFYADGNDLTAVDFDKKNLEILAKRFGASVIIFDLNEDVSALGNGKWDAVVMSEVLEHLYFPDRKMIEIRKLVKPGGVFLGSVPNGFSLKNRIRYLFNKPEGTTMKEPTHITHFSYKRIKGLLQDNFECVRIIPIQQRRYSWLAKLSPNFFAFLLAFECRRPKPNATGNQSW
jgi:2-polyprenyl-3-methyl-5-hydroxy-6-metoxy-1,4-benzoquinol methylase